jgi:hypothetical protein
MPGRYFILALPPGDDDTVDIDLDAAELLGISLSDIDLKPILRSVVAAMQPGEPRTLVIAQEIDP